MNDLSAQKPVHIVRILRSGQRAWLASVANDRDRFGQTLLKVDWDDDFRQSHTLTFEFANIVRRRLLEEKRLDVHFALEPNGPFIDEPEPLASSSRFEDSRQEHFVALDVQGRGFIVVPGHHQNFGPSWFVRALDQPTLSDRRHGIESVHGATPQEAAVRARDTWGEQFMFQDPDAPAREAVARRAAQQVEVQNQNVPRIRPGSWR